MKKIIAAMLIFVMAMSLAGCKSSDYQEAVKLQEAGDYAGALDLYKSIDGYESYKDTGERVSACEEMVAAIGRYENAKAHAEEENGKIEAAIKDAEALIREGKPAIDSSLIAALETAVSAAKAEKQELGEMPETAEEIIEAAEQLEQIDATEAITALAEGTEALKKSTEQTLALADKLIEASTGKSDWDYFEVFTSEEDRLVIVKVGMDGTADMVEKLKASGVSQNDAWDNVKNSLVQMGADYYSTYIESMGAPLHIGIQLVNDADSTMSILVLMDGIIMYDFLAAE